MKEMRWDYEMGTWNKELLKGLVAFGEEWMIVWRAMNRGELVEPDDTCRMGNSAIKKLARQRRDLVIRNTRNANK